MSRAYCEAMARLTINIDDALAERAQQRAAQNRQSFSAYACLLIEKDLDSDGVTPIADAVLRNLHARGFTILAPRNEPPIEAQLSAGAPPKEYLKQIAKPLKGAREGGLDSQTGAPVQKTTRRQKHGA